MNFFENNLFNKKSEKNENFRKTLIWLPPKFLQLLH